MATLAIKRLLTDAGLQATRKRIALAAILFDGEDKHVTADELLRAARKAEAQRREEKRMADSPFAVLRHLVPSGE